MLEVAAGGAGVTGGHEVSEQDPPVHRARAQLWPETRVPPEWEMGRVEFGLFGLQE